jgi:hypothetical protein
LAFAEIARHLVESATFDDVLTRIVEAAVATMTGCATSSITTRDRHGALATPTASDETAVRADHAQYEAGEGPCIDALHETLVRVDALPDARWPTLGRRPVDAGVSAVASYRLDMADVDEGSLNA